MANLIDTTYFFGPLLIPQLTEASVRADVQAFIDLYEPEYLQKMLGDVLYASFKTGYSPTVSSIYDAIVNGATYAANGMSYAWYGLKPTTKVTPLANYIYCKWMENNKTQTTGAGEKVLKAQNAETASANRKIITAWNRMVDMNAAFLFFMRNNVVTYPDFVYAKTGAYSRYSKEHANLLSKINPILNG